MCCQYVSHYNELHFVSLIKTLTNCEEYETQKSGPGDVIEICWLRSRDFTLGHGLLKNMCMNQAAGIN